LSAAQRDAVLDIALALSAERRPGFIRAVAGQLAAVSEISDLARFAFEALARVRSARIF
jgi:hypothetical protein